MVGRSDHSTAISFVEMDGVSAGQKGHPLLRVLVRGRLGGISLAVLA
jgi:hypothetical protein